MAIRCGKCCTGEGFVRVDRQECRRIAKFLGISYRRFLADYTQEGPDDHIWLIDAEGDHLPCVFLDEQTDGLFACRIEKVKPRQCLNFPSKWQRPDALDWCEGLRSLAKEEDTSE